MTQPRILIFDIETAPNLAYVWGQWEQNVIDHEREWTMLCYCYKWVGEAEIHERSNFFDYDMATVDDTGIVTELWRLFDEADIIIAHNGDKFDIRKANARFIKLGLGAPSPYKTIDTKKVASRYFAFNSNSLDNLGQHLGLGRKVKHEGWEMWKGCLAGDPKWWKKMLKYNVQDVRLLEKVWRLMQGFESNGPNMAALSDEPCCPKCGADPKHLEARGYHTPVSVTYHRYHCQKCGSWPSGTIPVKRDKVMFKNTTRR